MYSSKLRVARHCCVYREPITAVSRRELSDAKVRSRRRYYSSSSLRCFHVYPGLFFRCFLFSRIVTFDRTTFPRQRTRVARLRRCVWRAIIAGKKSAASASMTGCVISACCPPADGEIKFSFVIAQRRCFCILHGRPHIIARFILPSKNTTTASANRIGSTCPTHAAGNEKGNGIIRYNSVCIACTRLHILRRRSKIHAGRV